jgi:hypothetical protein
MFGDSDPHRLLVASHILNQIFEYGKAVWSYMVVPLKVVSILW